MTERMKFQDEILKNINLNIISLINNIVFIYNNNNNSLMIRLTLKFNLQPKLEKLLQYKMFTKKNKLNCA